MKLYGRRLRRPRLSTVLLVMTLAVGPIALMSARPGGSAAELVGNSLSTDLGGGLIGFSSVQSVSTAAYWDSYCPGNPSESCTIPQGLAYLPAENIVLVTESNRTAQGPPAGSDAIFEFDPATGSPLQFVALSCTPGVPFYPGTGVDAFVSCYNATSALLVVLNCVTGQAVTTIPLPFWPVSMTFDTQTGLVYAGGWAANGTMMLASIDPASEGTVLITSVPDGIFDGGFGSEAYYLAYDPATNTLLMPSVSGGILSVNPANGRPVSTIPLEAALGSLSVDSSTNQLFAAVGNYSTNSSSVVVFNAKTFAQEAQVSLPNCVDNGGDCTNVNLVTVMLTDPAHGDAYLWSVLGLFALNLSSMTIVGATTWVGGYAQSAVYLPSLDRIYTAPENSFQVSSGFMIQLDHTSTQVVSELLWLPTAEGILSLGAALGTVFAVVRSRGPPVPPRSWDVQPPSITMPPTEADERMWAYGGFSRRP